jgi:hypothetical protein
MEWSFKEMLVSQSESEEDDSECLRIAFEFFFSRGCLDFVVVVVLRVDCRPSSLL